MSSMRAIFSAGGSGTQVVRAHGVDEAQRPAFLAGAVVRQHEHQRVVELAAGSRKATSRASCWSAWSSIAA
jgi:hypothetical protein